MFIIKPIRAEEATGKLKLIYKKIQKHLDLYRHTLNYLQQLMLNL